MTNNIATILLIALILVGVGIVFYLQSPQVDTPKTATSPNSMIYLGTEAYYAWTYNLTMQDRLQIKRAIFLDQARRK